jgi:predicted nucleic acid-binding protein
LEDLDRMELGREVEEVAWELTARADGVSGADVVIVASAVLAKRRSGVPVEFVTADKDQALVAAREGLEILLLEGSDPL